MCCVMVCRFVVVCGDGEYIIYTAMALRNKSFGSAQEFVWAADASEYAVRESSSRVKIFKNFKEKNSLKPEFGCEGIYGGSLLGVRSANSLSFYDWDSQDLIRRIEIQVKHASTQCVCVCACGQAGQLFSGQNIWAIKPFCGVYVEYNAYIDTRQYNNRQFHVLWNNAGFLS